MDLDQYLEKMITNTIVIWILSTVFTFKFNIHYLKLLQHTPTNAICYRHSTNIATQKDKPPKDS